MHYLAEAAIHACGYAAGVVCAESIRRQLSWSARPEAHRAVARYARLRIVRAASRPGRATAIALVAAPVAVLPPAFLSGPARMEAIVAFALVPVAIVAWLSFHLMREAAVTGRLVELNLAGYGISDLMDDHFAAAAGFARGAVAICGAAAAIALGAVPWPRAFGAPPPESRGLAAAIAFVLIFVCSPFLAHWASRHFQKAALDAHAGRAMLMRTIRLAARAAFAWAVLLALRSAFRGANLVGPLLILVQAGAVDRFVRAKTESALEVDPTNPDTEREIVERLALREPDRRGS